MRALMMPGLRGAITEDHLSRLVAQTHQEVLAREEATPLNQLLRRVRPSDRYFHSALAQERFHLVGEIKNCCPIEGVLTDGVDTRRPSNGGGDSRSRRGLPTMSFCFDCPREPGSIVPSESFVPDRMKFLFSTPDCCTSL